MFEQKYNQPYYLIKLSEVNDETISVLSFEGEEQISGLFEYRIEILSKDPALNSADILNKPATFTLVRGEEKPENIYGIVSTFEQFGRSQEYSFYKITLVPHLWRLSLVYQNEVYQHMTIQDIIMSLLSDGGLKGSSYRYELKGQYPEREYIVQYKETNLNFLNRKLEHYGIFYYFDHSGSSDVVVFVDNNSYLPEIHETPDVEFNENKDEGGDGETIFTLMSKEKVVTGMVQVKDYNYLFPEKQLMAQSQIDPKLPGVYYDYGDNFETENEAETLAKIRNQEMLSESKVYYGESDNRLLRAGHRFNLNMHFREGWNTEYILTKVFVRGSQYGLFSMLTPDNQSETKFYCKFQAIPFTVDFRPQRKTPVPKMYGIMHARIDGPEGEEIFIDEHGRYKAKMFFDLSDASNGEASLWMRLQQNYAGAGYGVHFPNHPGSELLFACVDGDVDRPVGLGTIPNPSTATPVASKNKTQNVIRTAAGNELIMEDKKDETQITLTTPDANKIFFDDKDDKIEIVTKEKHKIILDDKNQVISITSKDGHTIDMSDYAESIIINSKKGHQIHIDDKDGNENIMITDNNAENSILIDIQQQKIVVESKEGNIDFLAPNGELNIKAKKIKIESETDLEVKSNKINTTAQSEITTKSNGKISTEATMDMKEKALNITSEASVEHKSKGLNLTVEAGVNMQVKGTLVTVQSSGPNTIKGLPVLIN